MSEVDWISKYGRIILAGTDIDVEYDPTQIDGRHFTVRHLGRITVARFSSLTLAKQRAVQRASELRKMGIIP